ncbi:MAG: hypothetical protein ACRCVU_17660 [Flavobacterium sp.]
MTKHILLIATIALLTVGCKETTPASDNSTPVESTVKSNEDSGSMAIPMHGTGENKSSATSGSFKMDDDMKKNIQEQKGQK